MGFIYQLSLTPISKEDYIHDVDFFVNGFLEAVAEHVGNDDDGYQENMETLFSMLENKKLAVVDRERRCFTLCEDMLTKHFKNRFKHFHSSLQELLTITEDSFINHHSVVETKLDQLHSTVNQTFDNYVSLEENWDTFDAFMWAIEPGATCYVGNILHYHL